MMVMMTIDQYDNDMVMVYRWAPDDAMDSHPDFLKFGFKFMVDCFEDCERELRLQERTYSVEETRDEVTNQTFFFLLCFFFIL